MRMTTDNKKTEKLPTLVTQFGGKNYLRSFFRPKLVTP